MPTFDQLISTLPANVQTLLRQMVSGGAGLSPRDLLRILPALLFGLSEVQRATLWRALIWLANAGQLELSTLIGASELLATGEGASVVAEGATAAGAVEAGAAATLAATVAAFLFMLLSLLLAWYTISKELEVEPIPAPSGLPCTGTGPKATVFTKTVRAFGRRSSYNKAVNQAMAHAALVMTCSGTACAPGTTCTGVAIPISVVPKFRFAWTTTDITYRVGCACI